METPIPEDSHLPVFIPWFISMYLFGYFLIFKTWKQRYRSEASSCIMSLAHGSPVLVLSLFSIYQSQGFEKLEFSSPNTPFQDLVLEYSISYFLMDLLHYLVFIPSDLLFIVHHLATLYVLMTCRYIFGHGAVAILGVLAIAEVTTTCQNTWSLARYQKVESEKARRVLELLSPGFYAYYSVVRGIIGPLFVYKIGLFFSSGLVDDVIPRWGWISWIVVIVAGIGLSILWVLHLWIDLYRERRKKEVRKLS